MKESPPKDDWIHLIHQDMVKCGIDISDESISLLSRKIFKNFLKTNMRKVSNKVMKNLSYGNILLLLGVGNPRLPLLYQTNVWNIHTGIL